MEYDKAFTFITEDEDWVAKFAVAALLMLASGIIPILPMLPLLGFTLELTRNVARGETRPLPRWDNMEEKLKQGALEFVVTLLYRLPLVLLGCLVVMVAVWVIFASASNSAPSSDTLASVIPTFVICSLCFSLLYSLSIGLLADAATVILAAKSELRAALKLRDALSLVQRYLGDFVMLLVVTFVGGLLSVALTIITCGLGALVAGPWLLLAQAHLLGQIARKAYPPMADALTPVAAQ